MSVEAPFTHTLRTFFTISAHCVPLPDAGAPEMTTFNGPLLMGLPPTLAAGSPLALLGADEASLPSDARTNGRRCRGRSCSRASNQRNLRPFLLTVDVFHEVVPVHV